MIQEYISFQQVCHWIYRKINYRLFLGLESEVGVRSVRSQDVRNTKSEFRLLEKKTCLLSLGFRNY
jgi:hypothetical protein